MTWPEAASWTIRGVGTAVTLEGGGALLVAGAAGVALAQPVPISRGMGEQIGAAERAERTKLVEAAHGGPVALPTPSPFSDERYVRTLPTEAQLEGQSQLAPHARPGSAPALPGAEDALEARRVYPNVDSNHLAAGVKALGDTGRCFPNFESFAGNSRQAMQQLSNVMQPPDGWETHHLVEQARTNDFGTQAIQNTANAINLPEAVHRQVSAAYSSRPLFGTEAYDYKLEHPEANISTVRDYAKALPYEAQRQFSLETIQGALRDPNLEISQHDRATVEHEIKMLENPSLCPPNVSQAPRSAPNISDVQAGVDRLRDAGTNVANAASVQPWAGKAQTGTFVDLGDGMVAQHVGRGAYAYMDVRQDLGGVQPPIGHVVSLRATGQMQQPDLTPAFSQGRG